MGTYLYFQSKNKKGAVEVANFLEEHPVNKRLKKCGGAIYLFSELDIEYAMAHAPHQVDILIDEIGRGSIKDTILSASAEELREAGFFKDWTFNKNIPFYRWDEVEWNVREAQTEVFEALNDRFPMEYYSGSCSLSPDGNIFTVEQMKRITEDGRFLSGRSSSDYDKLYTVLKAA